MKIFLKILFGGIFLWMLAMTIHVQAHKSLLLSPTEFSWNTSPWACATLFDAYFGFVTFFVGCVSGSAPSGKGQCGSS